MANPSNGSYFRLLGTAAGTQVCLAHGGDFNSLTIGTTTTGTATFYDTNTAGGTTSTNQLTSYTGSVRDSYPAIAVKNGLTAVVSGTVDMLLGLG